jgi:hypothetical protein
MVRDVVCLKLYVDKLTKAEVLGSIYTKTSHSRMLMRGRFYST